MNWLLVIVFGCFVGILIAIHFSAWLTEREERRRQNLLTVVEAGRAAQHALPDVEPKRDFAELVLREEPVWWARNEDKQEAA